MGDGGGGGGGRVGRWRIHYSDTLKVTNFMFLIVGMVVMGRSFFFLAKKWTFQHLHYCKSKNQKLTLILERRVFSRKKKKNKQSWKGGFSDLLYSL